MKIIIAIWNIFSVLACIVGVMASICLTIVTVSLLWFALPTPWGKLNLDAFPPQLRIVK